MRRLLKNIIRCVIFSFMYLSCLSWAQTSTPSVTDKPTPLYFTISFPVQSLVQSLADFSRLTGQAIIYNPVALKNINSAALNGNFSAEQILQKILSNSGFAAQWQHQGWVIKPIADRLAEQPDISEIVVTGYYSKNQQIALTEKRQSDKIIDAIVAEDIEKFPAQNIAEALQHSPGVTVVRDRGEALFISIRGLPASFNKVTLNGNTLATNENVRNSGQYGRRFHFDTFPAELVAGVDVIKSNSAEQDEGAIGGSVNIRTFTPFMLAKPELSLAASLDGSQLANGVKPRLSGLASWLNTEQTLGFTLAASIAERSLRQDRALNFGWENLVNPDFAPDKTIITPGSLRPTLELEERQRQGLTSSLQWRPTDALDIDVHWLALKQKIYYSEYSYGAGYVVDDLLPGSLRFNNNALISGQTLTGSAQISQESSGITDANRALDIGLKYRIGDWEWSVNVADSSAHSYNNKPIKRIRLHRDNDVDFSFYYPQLSSNNVPSINIQNINLENADDFYGRRLEWRIIDAQDHEQAYALAANYQIEGVFLRSLMLGIKHNNHQRFYQRKDALITQDIADVYFPEDAYQAFPVNDFLSYTKGNLPQQWLIPNEHYFWRNVDETTFYSQPMSVTDLLNSYAINEIANAFFIKVNLENSIADYTWRADVGIRLVSTEQTAQGYSLYNNLANPQFFSSNYTQWLPSANFIVEWSPQLLWRTSMAATMARPDFQDIAPRLTLNSSGDLTAVGGNPYLKPVTATQYDMTLEWYFADTGLLSAGVFYKQLDHFFQNQITHVSLNDNVYLLSAPGNGAQAHARGIEFSYQQKMHFLPAPFDHFGLETNYTYTDSRAKYIGTEGTFYDDLADVAKNSINLGSYFETDKMSIRLTYSWRDKVLNEVGTANTSALNTAAFGSLDMHLAYNLGAQGTLNVDAINLLNSAQQEFVSTKEFASYTLYGRRFLVGFKWNFL